MNLCFATYAFDMILSRLSSQKLSTIRPTKYNGVTAYEVMKTNIKKTSLPITVEFGTSKITMGELMKLCTGDIIRLEQKLTDEHPVKVGDKQMFLGQIGVVNKKKAIKITKKIVNKTNR